MKVWYAIPPAFRVIFETFASHNVYNTAYLTDVKAGAQLYILLKRTMVDRSYIGKYAPNVRLYRVFQEPGTFVYTVLGQYHCGFNCELNLSEAVKFSNGTWLDVRRVARSVTSLRHFPCRSAPVRIH